jgi:FkbM family methyltransferase
MTGKPMGLASRIATRLTGLAYLLENPRLIALRRHAGLLGTHRDLNQPWLTSRKIATVLDIGAHTGLFAITIRTVLPQAQIYCFEPLPDCFKALQARMTGKGNFAAFNVALGDSTGMVPFQRNDSTSSSSVLPMAELHTATFPHTRDVQTIEIKMQRLDDAVQELKLIQPLMLKIDVQGYEERVLRGGEKTLGLADVVVVETSLEKLYDGQASFDDVYRFLVDRGFCYHGSFDQLRHPQDGRILQQDSIFVRK